ncbi:hypothetical protein [Dactylosporangium sp. CA-139066]|uniref:hypothetical protein n=1 Tax=Dactylosporangium sp. CA-139066 TaxID=3239930 RepID=UPI003D9375F5
MKLKRWKVVRRPSEFGVGIPSWERHVSFFWTKRGAERFAERHNLRHIERWFCYVLRADSPV